LIRNETVTISVDATPIYPTSVRVTAGIGKGYNTCEVNGVDLTASVGQTLIVTLNTIPYSFLIDKKDYGKHDKVTLSCVGTPATLEDESISDTDYAYLDSDELIESSRGSVSVVNNIPNIVFSGQTYSKASTPMSRLMDMVRVIGGEVYEINGTLYLDIIKTIEATPTIVHEFGAIAGEVLDYAYSDNRDKSVKTKQVLINPITDDIYSDPSITLYFDDETEKGEVFFNPSLSFENPYIIEGIQFRPPTLSGKVETIPVAEVTHIKTLGGIDVLLYITINGEPVDESDYVIYAGHNIVRFLTPKTGDIIISYQTTSIIVYAFATTTFAIKYQCVVCSGTIEVVVDNIINSGACYAEIEQPLTYENGGTVLLAEGANATVIFVEEKGATNLVQYSQPTLAGGGVLTVKYLYTDEDWVDTDFMGSITSELSTNIETTSGEILYIDDLAEYVVYLDKPVQSINAIFFGSQAITGYAYDDTGDVPYISFQASDVGKTVDISITIALVDVTIPAPLVGHPVTLLDVISCDGVATQQFMLDENALCSLPATFKIDVATLFDLKISDIFGETLTGSFGDLIVDNFGMVEVTVTTATLHTIDCANIKENGTITVDANGVV